MATDRQARAANLAQFTREAVAELRKVTWPTRETVIRLTFIVLLISMLIGVYIFAFDNFFTWTITRGLLGEEATTPTTPVGP